MLTGQAPVKISSKTLQGHKNQCNESISDSATRPSFSLNSRSLKKFWELNASLYTALQSSPASLNIIKFRILIYIRSITKGNQPIIDNSTKETGISFFISVGEDRFFELRNYTGSFLRGVWGPAVEAFHSLLKSSFINSGRRHILLVFSQACWQQVWGIFKGWVIANWKSSVNLMDIVVLHGGTCLTFAPVTFMSLFLSWSLDRDLRFLLKLRQKMFTLTVERV